MCFPPRRIQMNGCVVLFGWCVSQYSPFNVDVLLYDTTRIMEYNYKQVMKRNNVRAQLCAGAGWPGWLARCFQVVSTIKHKFICQRVREKPMCWQLKILMFERWQSRNSCGAGYYFSTFFFCLSFPSEHNDMRGLIVWVELSSVL